MTPDTGPLKPGDNYKEWVIRGLIGKGGYGYVYDAYDSNYDIDVALKVIVKHVDRARTEGRTLVRLKHENIVGILGMVLTDDFVVIAMEKLIGRDLRKVLNDYGHISVLEALTIGAQVANALAVAHEPQATASGRSPVIHRDIKPENIFVTANNVVKVLDFGIAKVVGYGAKTTERGGGALGTPLFMSPEQLKGGKATTRSDIFALGTTLFEAMYRHPVFIEDDNPTRDQLLWDMMNTTPPLLSTLNPRIPEAIATIIHAAIVKDPKGRYDNAAAFARALEGGIRWLKEHPGEHHVPLSCRELSVPREATGQPAASARGAGRSPDTTMALSQLVTAKQGVPGEAETTMVGGVAQDVPRAVGAPPPPERPVFHPFAGPVRALERPDPAEQRARSVAPSSVAPRVSSAAPKVNPARSAAEPRIPSALLITPSPTTSNSLELTRKKANRPVDSRIVWVGAMATALLAGFVVGGGPLEAVLAGGRKATDETVLTAPEPAAAAAPNAELPVPTDETTTQQVTAPDLATVAVPLPPTEPALPPVLAQEAPAQAVVRDQVMAKPATTKKLPKPSNSERGQAELERRWGETADELLLELSNENSVSGSNGDPGKKTRATTLKDFEAPAYDN